MRPTGLTHRAMLESLGTNAEVGAALGMHTTTVSYWKKRGIPAVYWPALERLAKLRRLPITVEDLESASPARAVRRRCAA
jgi:hypothetical protein